MNLPRIFFVCLLTLSPLSAQDLTKFVSVSGEVHWYNPKGQSSLPCKHWGVSLYRLDSAGTRLDSVRTMTDSYGQYAFYGLPKGEYLLEIPKGFGRTFQKKTMVPGSVEPIVLPPRLPAIKDSSVFPIQVQTDYEKDPNNPKRFNFRLWAKVPREWKPLVKRVRYFMNHPSFTTQYLIGTDPNKDFAAGYFGWGCLENVSVEVQFSEETWTVNFPFCASLKQKTVTKKTAKPPA